ncbi:hypothetical protein H8959_002513 [Pygathrix nigripes]
MQPGAGRRRPGRPAVSQGCHNRPHARARAANAGGSGAGAGGGGPGRVARGSWAVRVLLAARGPLPHPRRSQRPCRAGPGPSPPPAPERRPRSRAPAGLGAASLGFQRPSQVCADAAAPGGLGPAPDSPSQVRRRLGTQGAGRGGRKVALGHPTLLTNGILGASRFPEHQLPGRRPPALGPGPGSPAEELARGRQVARGGGDPNRGRQIPRDPAAVTLALHSELPFRRARRQQQLSRRGRGRRAWCGPGGGGSGAQVPGVALSHSRVPDPGPPCSPTGIGRPGGRSPAATGP